MEVFVILWLLFGIVSAVVGANKGRSGCGWFVIGFLLGPFGLILALVMPTETKKVEKWAVEAGEMKKCPYCAELIRAEAIKCRYCGEAVPPDSRQGEIDAFIANLASPEQERREAAASRLGELGALAKKAIPALETARTDDDYRVRARAEWAIERIRRSIGD